MSGSPLHQLSELGQSVWIDSLSRDALRSGELARMLEEDAVAGVTSNPTIFQKAMAAGTAYDEQLREVLTREQDPKEVFIELAHSDITDACDLLRPIWDATDGVDGYVSWEVDPRISDDTEATIAEACRLNGLVERPNLYVKIPAVGGGLPAIEECIARGVPINVTLIFGLGRYEEVAEAYVRGLERFAESGGDLHSVISVASFFVSRIDTEVDRRLEELGNTELRGRLAIDNAKLAYQAYKRIFSSDSERWQRLAAAGARPQRCLWASTSTKNPDYRDVLYVEELIGPDTVNTMPGETIRAFQDHGRVRLTLEEGVDAAHRLLDEELPAAGIDYDDVIATLEREGVEKFAASFSELFEGIGQKTRSMVGAGA